MSKQDLMTEITALAERLNDSLSTEDGVIAALVIFHDWFAAHPQQVATSEIADAWNAGR